MARPASRPPVPAPPAVPRPWSRPPEAVASTLGVRSAVGLGPGEPAERRRRYGPNRLRRLRRRAWWRILGAQVASVMVVLLAAAAAIAFVVGDPVDGVAIGGCIAINVALGFALEWRATRTMEALARLGQVTARVRRDGRVREVPAADLVPGDVVLVEAGDVVTADLRLLAAARLEADEAVLTGESLPVAKDPAPVAPDAELPDRRSMLYKGTAITRGTGEAIVVATGFETEVGRITELTESVRETETPLERRLGRLGRRLVWLTLGVAAAVITSGVLNGRDPLLMFETAIALAVATVPEGLPFVATIALARGMWRLAARRALVNRLSAVETLGATGVICVDKTGTLTENRMSVGRIVVSGDELRLDEPGGDGRAGSERFRAVLELAALCSNAEVAGRRADRTVGDPMETALLEAAAAAGIHRSDLLDRLPEVREEAFDPATKMMATFHRAGGRFVVAVKGAPEAVLPACAAVRDGAGPRPMAEADRRGWLERSRALGTEGMRVLAVASRPAADPAEAPYGDLEFAGLVALADPPRAGVAAALAECRAAGIDVVMVTGDQAATARHVAGVVGLAPGDEAATLGAELADLARLPAADRARLLRSRIVARVTPEQKLRLVELHQAAGRIVAMTGDGVNDAPALKRADIGVAMGGRGTQVAREAADLVLQDDAFATITAAVREGRIIFENVRRFVYYLLSCNLSEVLVVGVATAVNAPLPILPLQILFLNLVTDVFPALALGAGGGDPAVMRRPPRPPTEPILTRRHWLGVLGFGGLITAAVLGAFVAALEGLKLTVEAAVTVSFLTLAFAQLTHVFNLRSVRSTTTDNAVVRNPFVWTAVAGCVIVVVAAVFFPPAAALLRLSRPTPAAWWLIGAGSMLPLLAGQLRLEALRRRLGPEPRSSV
ncbi:MAG: cation-translocating P-type ATPase [Gemmatimonadales bacterium]